MRVALEFLPKYHSIVGQNNQSHVRLQEINRATVQLLLALLWCRGVCSDGVHGRSYSYIIYIYTPEYIYYIYVYIIYICISVFSDFPSTFYDIDVRNVEQCLHAIVSDDGAFTRNEPSTDQSCVTINTSLETDPPLWLVESRVGTSCMLKNKPSSFRAETGYARVPLEHNVRLRFAVHRRGSKFVEDIGEHSWL